MITQRPHSFLALLLLVCLGLTTRIEACFREENNTSTIGTTTIASRLLETGSAYNLVLEVPGVKPRDLDISVDYDERRLVVAGAIRERETVVLLPPERYEDPVDSYHQAYLVVDDKVNLYDLTMAFTDGVVTVSVPKPVDLARRKNAKIRGATSSKTADRTLVLAPKHDLTTPSPPTKQLNYYHEASPPRVQPTISVVHAPRIAEMSEVDEEFQYWNHLI
jgi:HSP20 family molecular chaperone IbpA